MQQIDRCMQDYCQAQAATVVKGNAKAHARHNRAPGAKWTELGMHRPE
jgi:hypothetical protein